MKLLTNNNKISQNTAICLGKFDGIHLGHQKIINITIEKAKENNLKSVMHTFIIHPENFINSNKKTKLITDEEAKEMILDEIGMDYLYIDEFNHQFKKLTPEDFVYNILVKKLKAKIVVVGYNYKFGYKREGDTNKLKEICLRHGIKVIVVPKVIVDNKIVSSTLIRKYIKKGELEEVKKFLNRNFFIIGKVVSGKKIGSKLGFPTANLKVKDEIIYPNQGVYITKASIDGKIYNSITNVGVNPTVGGKKVTIETHVMSFNKNLYDKRIKIEFIKKIRNEMKFENIEKLKKQIKSDILYAEEYFRRESI